MKTSQVRSQTAPSSWLAPASTDSLGDAARTHEGLIGCGASCWPLRRNPELSSARDGIVPAPIAKVAQAIAKAHIATDQNRVTLLHTPARRREIGVKIAETGETMP